MDILVIPFVILGCVYAFYVGKTDKRSAIILVVALAIMFVFFMQTKTISKECFQDAASIPQTTTPSTALTVPTTVPLAKVSLDETLDPTTFNKITTVFLSTFNSASTQQLKARQWINIADPSTITAPCQDPKVPNLFTFSSEPIDTTLGVQLGSQNKLTGPLSCALGINYTGNWTILLGAIPKDLTVIGDAADISLFNLYANDTGNGVSIKIPKASVTARADGTLTCNLKVFIGTNQYMCTNGQTMDLLVDQDQLTTFFLVKDGSSLKLTYLTERSPTPQVLMSTKSLPAPTDPSVNFSNKAMEVNPSNNWNASLTHFAVFNTALPDDAITALFQGAQKAYLKRKVQDYNKLIADYNTSVDASAKAVACPFDAGTCSKCESITKWTNPIALFTQATTECKKAVNDVCATNPKNPYCSGCWDSSSPSYNSDACKMIRANFAAGDSNLAVLYDNLRDEDIHYIKTKNNLVHKDDCPKPSPPPTVPASSSQTPPAFTKPSHIRNYYKSGADIVQEGEELIPLRTDSKQKKGFWQLVAGAFTGA